MSSLYLQQATARQIVQRTMDIIKYSVNVMDAQGYIIASGDNSRIYQRHEGALLAITENRIVQIEQSNQSSLIGVKPGINLPIYFGQKIVGAIGISGPPAKVLNYAELVKMAAELIIEQTALLEENQWEQRYKQELARQLISETPQPSAIKAIAAQLNFDLSQSRVVIILQFAEGHNQKRRSIIDYFHNHSDIITIDCLNELIIIKPIMLRNQLWSLTQEQQALRQLVSSVEQTENMQLIIGGYFADETYLHRSYLSAKATQEMAKRLQLRQPFVFYHQHSLPALLGGLNQSWQIDELKKVWQSLVEKDKKNTLQATVRSYFQHNCDLTKTAQQLNIHSNTLRYRLQRIEQITHVKLSDLNGKLWLYIGMQFL